MLSRNNEGCIPTADGHQKFICEAYIAIVAGEDSGDILGADLIPALRQHFPNIAFKGIGGKRMIEAGFESFYPLDRLSVMGFFEPLKRLPELLSIRRHLKNHFLAHKPLAFIGIDAPDFNLGLEQALRKQGVKTVHYVSPTIWAWRPKRIFKIKKAVDHMLTIFPFENKIYASHAVPSTFVGHTLADQIPLENDKKAARRALGLPENAKIVALLPGSRNQELKFLAPAFIETAQWLKARDTSIQFISASANEIRENQFKAYAAQSQLEIPVFMRQSQTVMAAADVILTACGTAALEALLIKRPTVVAYKMSAFTFQIAKRVIKVPHIALPNLLAGDLIMPEFIQGQVNAQAMGEQILHFLNHPESVEKVMSAYQAIHQSLRLNAAQTAALAIKKIIDPTADDLSVLSPLPLAGEG